MRPGWKLCSLFCAIAVLLTTPACTCELEHEGPAETDTEGEPVTPPEPETQAPPLTGRLAVNGGYFEVSVPEGWSAQRTLRSTVLEPPREDARLRVIVGRPVPFEDDAAAYGEALRPVFEHAGFTGGPGREGLLGDVPAQIIDGTATGATARYWFVSVDGYGTSLSCTGRVAGSDQIHTACDDIAVTFRLTGSLAAHALLEENGEITIAGFHFTAPEGWRLFDPGTQAGVVAALRPVADEEDEAPSTLGATLTAQPFAADLTALRRQAQLTAEEDGHTIQLSEGTLLSQPAAAYDVNQPAELGGRRARVIETVSDGRAVRLSCYGAPESFEQVAAACDTIARSLRE